MPDFGGFGQNDDSYLNKILMNQALNQQGQGGGNTLGTMAGMNAAASPYGRPDMGMDDPTGMNEKNNQNNMLMNQQKASQNSADIAALAGGGGDSGGGLSGLSSILSLFGI